MHRGIEMRQAVESKTRGQWETVQRAKKCTTLSLRNKLSMIFKTGLPSLSQIWPTRPKTFFFCAPYITDQQKKLKTHLYKNLLLKNSPFKNNVWRAAKVSHVSSYKTIVNFFNKNETDCFEINLSRVYTN